MSARAESAEGITVPAGDPEALRRSAHQLEAVHDRMWEASLRLGSTPSFMSGWFGPGSSAFAGFTGQQARSLASRTLSVGSAAAAAASVADDLDEAQAKARRAIDRAREAREAIDRAKAAIDEAQEDQQAARTKMQLAAVARDAARSDALGAVADVVTGGGGSAALMAAADEADRQHRAAQAQLGEAERREHQAKGRLEHARTELEKARKAGREADDAAQSAADFLRVVLDDAGDAALLAPGGAAYGLVADSAAGALPARPQPPRPVGLSEREPPSDWPGWAKALFKVGRGEAVVLQGLYNTGRGAVERPERIPGGIRQFGEDTYNDPIGTGKSLIGYDELSKGRYEDWLGQIGLGVLAGGGATRLARRKPDTDTPDTAKPDAASAPKPALPTPRVESPKLQNIVDDLHKGTTNPNRVGNGTTADAIRQEIAGGQATAGRFHTEKGQQYSRALEKFLEKNPNAPVRDRLVARSIYDDLQAALRGR